MSKGPHSLGGNNSNNIGIKYRDLHPSMLGQIDVLVCGKLKCYIKTSLIAGNSR